MRDHVVKIPIPHSIYEQLSQIAKITNTPLEEVLVQTIRGGMPPSLKKVPKEFHDELLALNKMDDTQLWNIVQGKLPSKIPPSAEREKADFPTLRRAYAFSLLKWRGHPVPSPHEMMLE